MDEKKSGRGNIVDGILAGLGFMGLVLLAGAGAAMETTPDPSKGTNLDTERDDFFVHYKDGRRESYRLGGPAEHERFNWNWAIDHIGYSRREVFKGRAGAVSLDLHDITHIYYKES